MKYKLIGEKTSFGESVLITVLKNRGINNINLFLNPDNSSDTDLDLVKNMELGTNAIKDTILKDGKIIILVDSDCDGMTSGAIMYTYLRKIYKAENVDYFIHKRKEHGLTSDFMKHLETKRYDLIIVPDAGSSDVQELEYIETIYKTKIVVIDHHEIEEKSEYGIIINNQECDNTNGNLSGAGMTYLVCKMLEREYNTGILNELSNLATMGLIGDSCDLVDNEVRNICISSLKNIENNFLNKVNEHKKKSGNIVISDLSFNGAIPLINSVVRVGTLEERILLFEALADIEPNRTYIVKKRKLNKETRKYEIKEFKFNLYQYVIDICEKARSRQESLVKKATKEIEGQYNKKSGVQVFVIEPKHEFKGITGLIANNLANKYKQPVIICWNYKGLCKGSLRGYTKVLKDFKSWCKNTGLFELVQGHSNAAGVEFKYSNYNKIIELAQKVTPEEVCYNVDKIYKELDTNDIFIIDANKKLWSKGCEKPLFAIEDLVVNKSNIFYSKRTLRICLPNYTIVKFNSSEAEYDKLLLGFNDYINLNIVGEFSMNEWMNKKYPQVILKDFEVINNTGNNNFNIFN